MSDIALRSPVPSAGASGVDTRVLSYAVKRIMDIVLAALILVVVSPLLLTVALAIKLDDGGPVLFAQVRVGGRRARTATGWSWVARPFTMYKFRTMRAGADPALHREYMAAYVAGDHDRLEGLRPGRRRGESYRPADDPRVTRVGSRLRRASLDELPQLWNVLRGEMSLVGPRPPLPYEVTMYREHHLRRLAGRPGITGLAQVRGRTSIGMEDTVKLDLEYLERRSLRLDLKILLMTIPAVLLRRGAD